MFIDLNHFALLGNGEGRLDVIAGDHDRSDLRRVQLLDRRLRLFLYPDIIVSFKSVHLNKITKSM
jgi:hypothetical protein